MNHADAEALRACQLDMLKHFISICENSNLQYYILGGTLLGAVRHKGYIPWDDDIDLGMPRRDYERFLSIAGKYLPGHCFLQTNRTDPGWPSNFAKLRNSQTTFIESSVRNRKMNHGVYIDVFPLDFYPDGKMARRCFDLADKLLQCRIRRAFLLEEKHALRSLLAAAICPRLQWALCLREMLMRSVEQGRLFANHCGAWGDKERMPKEWFSTGAMLEFEGIPVRAPLEYQKYLKQLYGDYMTLPPLEERRSHHHAAIIDLKHPYTQYMPDK